MPIQCTNPSPAAKGPARCNLANNAFASHAGASGTASPTQGMAPKRAAATAAVLAATVRRGALPRPQAGAGTPQHPEDKQYSGSPNSECGHSSSPSANAANDAKRSGSSRQSGTDAASTLFARRRKGMRRRFSGVNTSNGGRRMRGAEERRGHRRRCARDCPPRCAGGYRGSDGGAAAARATANQAHERDAGRGAGPRGARTARFGGWRRAGRHAAPGACGWPTRGAVSPARGSRDGWRATGRARATAERARNTEASARPERARSRARETSGCAAQHRAGGGRTTHVVMRRRACEALRLRWAARVRRASGARASARSGRASLPPHV